MQIADFLKWFDRRRTGTRKTLLKAETIYARDGLSGIANIMGWIRMIGLDTDYFSNWPKLIDKITAQQVMDAAKDTLKREQCVTALLLHQTKLQNQLNLLRKAKGNEKNCFPAGHFYKFASQCNNHKRNKTPADLMRGWLKNIPSLWFL
jgi:hypothetical protein